MENQLLHAFHNRTVVQDLSFEPFTKTHDVIQINGDIPFLCDFQNVLGAVVAASGGVEHHIGAILDQKQGLGATGELHRRNHA